MGPNFALIGLNRKQTILCLVYSFDFPPQMAYGPSFRLGLLSRSLVFYLDYHFRHGYDWGSDNWNYDCFFFKHKVRKMFLRRLILRPGLVLMPIILHTQNLECRFSGFDLVHNSTVRNNTWEIAPIRSSDKVESNLCSITQYCPNWPT